MQEVVNAGGGIQTTLQPRNRSCIQSRHTFASGSAFGGDHQKLLPPNPIRTEAAFSTAC
jgi:hypothetical protein